MKGNGITIEEINAALQNAGIFIIDAPRELEVPKYLQPYHETKQHERYGWYRKFDTKKKY